MLVLEFYQKRAGHISIRYKNDEMMKNKFRNEHLQNMVVRRDSLCLAVLCVETWRSKPYECIV